MVEFGVYAIAIVVMVGFGWLVRRQLRALRSARHSAQNALLARLAAPDWERFAEHLQRAVAPEFVAMYEKFAVSAASREFDLGEGWLLTEFFPLDDQALEEQKQFHLPSIPFDYLPFASGVSQSQAQEWFFRPGAMASDQILCVARQNGEWHELGLNPAQLLQRLQAAAG